MAASKPATTAVAQTVPVTPTSQPVTTSTPTSQNASRALVRINQLDPSQYNSAVDVTTWTYSACSAAALAEVINSYGFAYRIADILHVEAQIGAITPSQGLTTESGIANTAQKFGFTTKWGHNLSLDQVIATANAGQPVIVSWPPQTYDGGHIVVVTGGTASTVYLADSSKYDRPSVSRTQFAAWWRGFSAILTPLSKDVPAGKPTISVAFINQVLAHYNSPAAGQGQALYSLGQQYDIDPAYALAFFFHESSFGTAGMARITHSLGNSRCVQDASCINTSGGDCQAGQSCYAGYANWADGFAGWYRQMTAYLNGSLEYYLTQQWKPLTTLETIIPVYAPSSDHNDVSAYISAIQTAVATWQSGKVVVP
jgi:predicted double-glycine peptidase